MTTKKIKLTAPITAVRCERNERVDLPSGTYEALSVQKAKTAGYVILMLKDTKEAHPGGDDGKTMLPCTLRAQVQESIVSSS